MQITFDGFEGPHLSCPTINLWYDHVDRAKRSPDTGLPIVAVVPHGCQGTLIRQEGEGCLVEAEVEGGGIAQGWVTFFFIKELKGEWQREQLAKALDAKKVD